MKEEELEEIAKRSNAARKGPWISFIEGRDFTSGSSFIRIGSQDNRGSDIELIGATAADQDFIAAARQDIPKLLEEIRRLKELVKALKA